MELSIFSSLNNTPKWLVILISLLGFTVPASATTIFDNFEGIGDFLPNGEIAFNVGSAHFSGGVSGIAGIGELYKSGVMLRATIDLPPQNIPQSFRASYPLFLK